MSSKRNLFIADAENKYENLTENSLLECVSFSVVFVLGRLQNIQVRKWRKNAQDVCSSLRVQYEFLTCDLDYKHIFTRPMSKWVPALYVNVSEMGIYSRPLGFRYKKVLLHEIYLIRGVVELWKVRNTFSTSDIIYLLWVANNCTLC